MEAIVTPAVGLRYLHELSVDLRAVAVLDRRGAVLAGEPALGDPDGRWRQLLDEALGAGCGGVVAVGVEGSGGGPASPGVVVVARSAGEHDGGPAAAAAPSAARSIVAVAGRQTLVELLVYDLERVLADLGAGAGSLPVRAGGGPLSGAGLFAAAGRTAGLTAVNQPISLVERAIALAGEAAAVAAADHSEEFPANTQQTQKMGNGAGG